MSSNISLDDALNNLRTAIQSKSAKKQQILAEWINQWSKFLLRESVFSSKYLPYYKRGDIVYVDFGFNIGTEYGGVHYAVVIEDNNNKTNGNIIVVPLTSLDPGKSISDISPADVYIGDNVIGWTSSATVAKPNQIRSISKMRIIKPTHPKDKTARLTGAQLQLIDDKLKRFIFPK